MAEQIFPNKGVSVGSHVIGVGSPAPDFELPAVQASGQIGTVRLSDFLGRWLMLVFYPRDFSFVCPTELTAFSARIRDFNENECAVLGVSIDSIDSHLRWLQAPVENGGIGPLQFPLASDTDGTVSQAYGIWNKAQGLCNRALFLIDPAGQVQYFVVHALSVGRSPEEVLRVLGALRTGGICPASWTSADGTLDIERMLQPGRVLGHYRIEKELGRGGFGSVMLAWDLRLERRSALKVLRHNKGHSRDALMAEARLAAAVRHPNVCTIYAAEEIDGLPVIAMEYLSGQPLSRSIDTKSPRFDFRSLAGGLAAGLAAAHGHNIVHGDLKPANILVTDEGAPVIVDFGLSKFRTPKDLQDRSGAAAPDADRANSRALLDTIELSPNAESPGIDDDTTSFSTAALAGTPAYMSPEQARGQTPTPASDVFSLGLVFFEMLTGRRAMNQGRLINLLRALQRDELAEELASEVPAAHRSMLSAMLQSDPERRCSANDVAEALHDAVGT